MPRIGDVYGQPENAGNIRRGEGRRAERTATDRSKVEDRASVAPSSDDVREIRAHQARLIDAAKNAPDVRADRVAQARARLQEGFYDTPEVRSAVADRMLQSFEGKSSS
jgi:hypothetical protein